MSMGSGAPARAAGRPRAGGGRLRELEGVAGRFSRDPKVRVEFLPLLDERFVASPTASSLAPPTRISIPGVARRFHELLPASELFLLPAARHWDPSTGSRRPLPGESHDDNRYVSNDARKEGFSMASASTFDDPGALSGPLAGISFVGGLATGLSLADAPFPLPAAEVKDIQRFFVDNAGPERINVTGQLISAASLAQFSTSVVRLAGRAGRGSKALRAAAIAGGALATASLAASAAAAAALTAAPGRDKDRARFLHRVVFAAGGPVHGAGLALLLGALGLAGLRTGVLPRPLALASLTSAGVDALAPVVLAVPGAAPVIPAGRFPTFVVLGLAGVRLARGSARGTTAGR
jgi:hypothetical protein